MARSAFERACVQSRPGTASARAIEFQPTPDASLLGVKFAGQVQLLAQLPLAWRSNLVILRARQGNPPQGSHFAVHAAEDILPNVFRFGTRAEGTLREREHHGREPPPCLHRGPLLPRAQGPCDVTIAGSAGILADYQGQGHMRRKRWHDVGPVSQ